MLDRPGQCRIAFKPHLRAHVLSDSEVALIGEFERYALRGRAFAILAPLLDGTRDADQIVAAVSDDLAPEATRFALAYLQARGYTCFKEDAPSDSWSDWWLADDRDGAEHGRRLVTATVMVSAVGELPEIVDLLSENLAWSLDVVSDGAQIEVCLIDDYLRPELAAAAGAARAAGRVFLPVRPVGVQVWIGPLMTPHTWREWDPFLQRLQINHPVEATIAGIGGQFPLRPALATPQSIAIAIALAAKLIVRVAAGDIPAVIEHAVWSFDTRSFTPKRHPLPATAPMTTTIVEPTQATAIDIRPCRKSFTADGGHRTCPPEATLARLDSIVSPITGIVPKLDRLSDDPSLHVYGSLHRRAQVRQRVGITNRMLGYPDRAVGKGETDAQARASCLAEAVERYSAGCFPDSPVRRARLEGLGADAVHPNDVLLFSAQQYESRAAWNAQHGASPNRVPEPFDEFRPIDWTPVWSLTQERTRWLASAQCFFDYPSADASAFAHADSNGCAAGNTREEAILQGILELVERDACALWWYSRARRPAIDLDSFGRPFFEHVRERCQANDCTLHVLDLRTEFEIPVVLAVSWQQDDGGNIHFGLGCHLEPRLAVSRALTELNQMLSFEGPSSDQAARIAGEFSPGLIRWLADERVGDHANVAPNAAPAVVASDFTDFSCRDLADDIKFCVGRVADNGLETLVLDMTRPEIGFPTVRVVIPGLRHFWARLAPGRLYDSPVALGWLERRLREDEVNPIPFFL